MSNSAATSPTPGFTLSGVVYESTASGSRPLAGVGLEISAEYQTWPPQTTADGEGRYQLSGLSGSMKVRAVKAGYSQPCRAPTTAASNSVLDIYVVSDEILSTSGVPSSMPIRQPTLSGLVYERTPEGTRPIPGAEVLGDFTGGLGWAVSAATRSDAMGHYLLCGVDAVGFGFSIYVTAPGYVTAYLPVDVRTIRSFDIELAHQ